MFLYQNNYIIISLSDFLWWRRENQKGIKTQSLKNVKQVPGAYASFDLREVPAADANFDVKESSFFYEKNVW